MQPSFPIKRASELLLDGGVIAYPTEGVYGIGCIPDYEFAVTRIFDIKGRSATAGLILIAPAASFLYDWIAPTPAERQRLQQSADFPTTWVVTARPGTPDWLTGGRATLAIRISDHPVVSALCRLTGSALVSTSANQRGRPPAKTALQARKFLGNTLDFVLAGPLSNVSGPSEIRVALDDRVIRARQDK